MNYSRVREKRNVSDVEIKGSLKRKISNIFHVKRRSVDKSTPVGMIDIPFLIYCIILLLFGMLMNYSASSVYAEQMYNNSTYFLIRYVIFSGISVTFTYFFVNLHIIFAIYFLISFIILHHLLYNSVSYFYTFHIQIRRKGNAYLSIMQIFRTKKFSTGSKSFPKQNRNAQIISTLRFL